MRHTIFFSYARSDAPFVLKLASALRAQGRTVWVDQLDIPKGARWDEEVEKALTACTCLIVVLSPASAKSQNVLDEVSYALDEKRTVLPILLQAGSIPFRLKRLQYIDFTTDFDSAYLQLVAALDALPGPQAPGDTEESATVPEVKPVETAAEIRRVEAPAQHPEPEAVTARQSAIAPSGLRTGMVTAVAAVFILGISYIVFAPPKNAPLEPAREKMEVTAVEVKAEEIKTPVEVARKPAAAPALSDAQVKAFVNDYIDTQNRANAVELLRFYADRVDYFDQKGVGRQFILKDKQNYYRRWPEVENRLVSELNVNRSHGEDSVLVSYTIQWRAHSPVRGANSSGTARDELMLRLMDGEVSIIAQHQQVIGAVN